MAVGLLLDEGVWVNCHIYIKMINSMDESASAWSICFFLNASFVTSALILSLFPEGHIENKTCIILIVQYLDI